MWHETSVFNYQNWRIPVAPVSEEAFVDIRESNKKKQV